MFAVTAPFFHMKRPQSASRRAEWVDGEVRVESVSCPVDPDHQRSGRRLTDLSLELPGRIVDDFVWTWYGECLVQDSVVEVFKALKLTGYELRPIRARHKASSGANSPTLWELVVTGWGGVAPRASGVKIIEECEGCGHRVYSAPSAPEKLLDHASYDGSDLFMIWPLPRFILVRERVVQAVVDNEFTGVQFGSLEEQEYTDGTLTPGRLSQFMPPARARKLGGRLGID